MLDTEIHCERCGRLVAIHSSPLDKPPKKLGPSYCGNCGTALGLPSALDGPGSYFLKMTSGGMVLVKDRDSSWERMKGSISIVFGLLRRDR